MFSSLWATHTIGMIFDFILIVPLLPSFCGFFFVFGGRISFFDRHQHFSDDGCSAVSCDSGVFVRKSELMSFYSIILSPSLIFCFLNLVCVNHIKQYGNLWHSGPSILDFFSVRSVS